MLTETKTSPGPAGTLWLSVRDFLRYKLPHAIGLDRAIAFTVLGRVVQGLGSVGSLLLIVHFLSPAEQGYYYACGYLVALQSVFELGFSFVILQVAAHERAHLEFHGTEVLQATRRRIQVCLTTAASGALVYDSGHCDGRWCCCWAGCAFLRCINSHRRRISG